MKRLAFPCALLLTAGTACASMIVDRAPNARAVVEVFVDHHGARLAWEEDRSTPPPQLTLRLGPGPHPRTLTLAPPSGAGPEDIGFVVYHLGLPVTDLHYLVQPETLDLDWDDPWQSRFRNPRLRRLYDSPFGVFLHVGRYELRVEVVGRPVDFNLRRIDPATLAADVSAFLDDRWTLTVDGQPVLLPLDRCQFLERRLRRTLVTEPPPPGAIRSSTLGVVYRRLREELPSRVELIWNAFPATAESISASVTEDGFMEPFTLRPGRNVLRWESRGGRAEPAWAEIPSPPPARPDWFAVVPYLAGLLLLGLLTWVFVRLRAGRGLPRTALLAGFVLIAAGAVSIPRREPVFQDRLIIGGLLRNIYRAFDFPGDEEIYDGLARSVSGRYLTEVYLEVRRALELERSGGARIKVRSVEVEQADTKTVAAGGFRSDCTWTLTGSVAHWGHVHARVNRYRALVTVRPVDGAWKITALELRNEERLPVSFTGLRASESP